MGPIISYEGPIRSRYLRREREIAHCGELIALAGETLKNDGRDQLRALGFTV